MSFSLYLHVPFCTRTCPYCNFYQIPYRAAREDVFVPAVLREAELLRDELGTDGEIAETLYWGGGTPSLLSPRGIHDIAMGLSSIFAFAPSFEFTVEANPGEVPPETLRALREAGANRLSLGCQSFQAERLAFLGRLHSAEQNRRAVREARAAGFANVNLDLIFNLPASFATAGWHADLTETVALQPEHVSLYGLTLEPRTLFAARAERGRLALLEGEAYAQQYLLATRILGDAGYVHYETSSFALPGRESAHNRRYWTGGNYLGLGPAAHSFWQGRRWANVASHERYLESVLRGEPEREADERSEASLYAETLYLGLRSDGVAARSLRGVPAELERFLAQLVEAGLARVEEKDGPGERIVLRDAGHLVLDEIVTRLLALDVGEAADGKPDPVRRTSGSDSRGRSGEKGTVLASPD